MGYVGNPEVVKAEAAESYGSRFPDFKNIWGMLFVCIVIRQTLKKHFTGNK